MPSIDIYGDKSAEVRWNNPGVNYSGAIFITAQDSTGSPQSGTVSQNALFSFPGSVPAGATIIAADLVLNINGADNAQGFTAYRLAADFVESTVNWNTQPAVDATVGTAAWDNDPSGHYVAMRLVAGTISPATRLGIRIQATPPFGGSKGFQGSVSIYTEDQTGTAQDPYLSVTYRMALPAPGAFTTPTTGAVVAQAAGVTVTHGASSVAPAAPVWVGAGALLPGASYGVGVGPAIGFPAGIADGDLLVMWAMIDNSNTLSTPAGWTLVNVWLSATTNKRYYLWKKISAAGQGSTPVNTGGVNGTVVGQMYAYRGSAAAAAAGSLDIDQVAGTMQTAAASPVAASITPTRADSRHVIIVAKDTTATQFVSPAGYIERVDLQSTGNIGRVGVEEKYLAGTGATGSVAVASDAQPHWIVSLNVYEPSAVQYEIDLSTDGGATWAALLGLSASISRPADFSTKPTTSNAVLRVRAYDGTYSSYTLSGTFSIGGAKPRMIVG
jgi:hypothetical protein